MRSTKKPLTVFSASVSPTKKEAKKSLFARAKVSIKQKPNKMYPCSMLAPCFRCHLPAGCRTLIIEFLSLKMKLKMNRVSHQFYEIIVPQAMMNLDEYKLKFIKSKSVFSDYQEETKEHVRKMMMQDFEYSKL